MAATITINSIVFSPTPGAPVNVRFRYKKTSDLSFINLNGGTYIPVPANGTLTTPIVISGLDYNTQYTVEAKSDCGTLDYTENLTTPSPACPAITDIVMVATN